MLLGRTRQRDIQVFIGADSPATVTWSWNLWVSLISLAFKYIRAGVARRRSTPSRFLWDLRSHQSCFKTSARRFLHAVGLQIYKIQSAFEDNIVKNDVGGCKIACLKLWILVHLLPGMGHKRIFFPFKREAYQKKEKIGNHCIKASQLFPWFPKYESSLITHAFNQFISLSL